jgi:predicted enzyme related to lactoylglutathione lyase
MNPVVHFEMPYEDRDRMADFYKKAFGWQVQMLGPEMGEYVVMTTAEMDPETKFPKKPGQINGGFFKRSEENKHPSVVISVEDIRKVMKEVEAAGGKLVGIQTPGEPVDIPGIGLYAGFIDPEGNRVSMLQPNPMM